jgi:hypothetical protein
MSTLRPSSRYWTSAPVVRHGARKCILLGIAFASIPNGSQACFARPERHRPVGALDRHAAMKQEFGRCVGSSLLEPGPVGNQRIAIAPNSLATRVATIDGGYERLHFESIEQTCGLEGEHQLGTASRTLAGAAPCARDLATERRSHSTIQASRRAESRRRAQERGGRRHRRLRYAGILSM